MPSFTYKIFHLPTNSPLLPLYATKFSVLRLHALTVSPTAFSSTFATESQYSAQVWQDRLLRKGLNIFVAVAIPSVGSEGGDGKAGAHDEEALEKGEWVGSATLLGPFSKEEYELPESGGPVVGDSEGRWQMSAVFNSPEHRGKGIAKMLILGALDFAAKYSTIADQKSDRRADAVENRIANAQVKEAYGNITRVRIMIHPDNVVVKKLYQGLGFNDAGNCTLAEAIRSNGDADMLPEDGGESEKEKYHSRHGIVMEKNIEG